MTRFSVVLLALGASGLPEIQTANADSVLQAQEALSQSYNNFFEALQKSPTQSPEWSATLLSRIVEPASKNLSQAVHDETRAAFAAKGIKLVTDTRPQNANEASSVASPSPGSFAGSLDELPGPTRFGGIPPKDDIVLDGNDIPRELSFPGKPSPTANNSAKTH